MNYCGWAGCGIPLTYKGRGRPPEYCPEHAEANTKRLNKARPGGGHERKSYPPCCLDAQAAKVRAYGMRVIRYQDWRKGPLYELYKRVVRVGSALVKAANVRVCGQHQQWRAFYRLGRGQFLAVEAELRAEDNSDQLAEIWASERFRITASNPDGYFTPDPSMQIEVPSGGVGWDGIPLPSAKSGYDAQREAETRQYLALAPNGQSKVSADRGEANEPDPLIAYWRDRCAEGRRWHKEEAFRYPPEMNRGAGWCAKLIPIDRGTYPLSNPAEPITRTG